VRISLTESELLSNGHVTRLDSRLLSSDLRMRPRLRSHNSTASSSTHATPSALTASPTSSVMQTSMKPLLSQRPSRSGHASVIHEAGASSAHVVPQEHLRAWLSDPQGRDQYVTYREDDVSVLWHGKPAQLAYEKKVRDLSHSRYRLAGLLCCRTGPTSTSPGRLSVLSWLPCIARVFKSGVDRPGSACNDSHTRLPSS